MSAYKFEFLDDSKADTGNPPPSYDAGPTSIFSLLLGVSVQRKQLDSESAISPIRIQQTITTVKSLIRDIVTAPDITSSSVPSIVNSCAAALPAAEFSDLLQDSDTDGHTALYWAIVNNRQETLSVLVGFITPRFSNACNSDLRLACAVNSNHNLFMQLGLTNVGEIRKPFLGCPPDEVEVSQSSGLGGRNFAVVFRFKMCQQRLRVKKSMAAEFVAEGRIWLIDFYMGDSATNTYCNTAISLTRQSHPVRPKAAVVRIAAHKGPSGCELQISCVNDGYKLLVPEGHQEVHKPECRRWLSSVVDQSDSLMQDNTKYL